MDRTSQRYVILIRLLGASMGHRHGWRSEVARQLGVHPSYVTRLLNGERVAVGPGHIERAIRDLHMSPDFFYGEKEPTTLAQRAFPIIAGDRAFSGIAAPIGANATDVWNAPSPAARLAEMYGPAEPYTWHDVTVELDSAAREAVKLAPDDAEMREMFRAVQERVRAHATKGKK